LKRELALKRKIREDLSKKSKKSIRNNDIDIDNEAGVKSIERKRKRRGDDEGDISFGTPRQEFVDNSPLPSSAIRKMAKRSYEDISDSGGSDHGEDWNDRDSDNEKEYDPFNTILTEKDLPDYDSDASRDSDTETERDIKRRARNEKKKVTKSSKRPMETRSFRGMQVNLTSFIHE
jgi:hypothetical protein